jgi:DNA-directed RNA polymerase specialized sigma24 family protein
VTETAEVLGCPPGTVKAAASRGLARLRELGGQGGTEISNLIEERC